MTRITPIRWAAALTLAIALTTSTASAQEVGTVTITGTFTVDALGEVGPDLAQIFADGGEYTWTLTLYGVSYSHSTSTFLAVHRFTNVHATSFELEFSGPQADALNALMSDQLTGGSVSLQLRNAYNSSRKSSIGDFQFATMMLWVDGPAWPGISFWAGHESFGIFDPFPADADGYPVVESEPFLFGVEGPYIIDYRSGNEAWVECWWSEAAIYGDAGSPRPAMLSIQDGSILEGDRGNTNLHMDVRLSNTSNQAITVSYRTVDGTAKAKEDYNATSGTLTFQPGETSRTITIPIKGDRKREADETFSVNLSNALGATIDNGVATVTILDDD